MSKTIQSGARDAVAWASVLLALTLPLSAADAQGGNESSVHEPGYSYESLLKRIHDYDLTGAGHVIDSFIGRLPADPKPYFFFTLARWWRLAGETSSDSLQTSFLEAAGKSVEVARRTICAHIRTTGKPDSSSGPDVNTYPGTISLRIPGLPHASTEGRRVIFPHEFLRNIPGFTMPTSLSELTTTTAADYPG